MLYVIGFVCISVAFVFYKGSFSQLSERLNVFNYLHTDKERLILWSKSISLIKSHMFFGVGAGNWQIVYPNSSIVGLDRVEFSNITFQRPHNDFLWIISESGLTGFFFYIIVLFALIFCSIKYILSKNNYSYKMQILILTCFLSGYLVISFFDFPRERIEHIILFNTIIGIIYSMLDNEFKFKSLTIFKIKKIYFGLLIMPIFILITYIGAKRYHGESNSKQLYYYMDKGQTNNALNSFEAAYSIFFTIDPTSIPLHWYRGTLNFQMEKYSEALSDFQKAYTYNPYNKNVLNDLASSYEKNGNHNKAKELYNESLRISPNFNDPKLNLSAIYFKEGNYIKALDVIKTVSDGDDRKKHFYDIIVSHLHK
ncbi:MAG: tetratricopeptide repeat protein [Bacteroidota bacterium]|nr:tetratricopeptide repeat protein [Bacteroidota bacterium]